MRSSNTDPDFVMQLAPMLSGIFVLLLFTMVWLWWPMEKASREGVFSLPLPPQPHAYRSEVPVFITIAEDGTVAITGTVIADQNDTEMVFLVDRLKGIMAANASQPVLIEPELSAKHQRLMDVLNACSQAGVRNIQLGKEWMPPSPRPALPYL